MNPLPLTKLMGGARSITYRDLQMLHVQLLAGRPSKSLLGLDCTPLSSQLDGGWFRDQRKAD